MLNKIFNGLHNNVGRFFQAKGNGARYTQMDSKFGNLAKPAPKIWGNEVATKQLNLNSSRDAGGPKDEDVRRSQKPNFEFVCVYMRHIVRGFVLVAIGSVVLGWAPQNMSFAQENFPEDLRKLIESVEDTYPVFKFQEGDDLPRREAYQAVLARQTLIMTTGTEEEKAECKTQNWFMNASLKEREARREDFEKIRQKSKEIFQTITKTLKTETVPAVGYGSLLNPDSAENSFSPETVNASYKVFVYGHHRIFNFNWPFFNPLLYGSKTETAFLNIMRLENPESYINAVRFSLSEQEFINLRVRELGYDLVPVVTQSHSADKKIEIAYAVRASHPNYLTGPNQKPKPSYVATVVAPLATVTPSGEIIGGSDWPLYLETTRLANGWRLVDLQQDPDFFRFALGKDKNYKDCQDNDIR